jgi:hypothetical protein
MVASQASGQRRVVERACGTSNDESIREFRPIAE